MSPAAVLVAGNSFDAVEKTATNYIVFCTAHRANPACANFITIRGKLVPAIRSAPTSAPRRGRASLGRAGGLVRKRLFPPRDLDRRLEATTGQP